jgi:hypothetical protein
VALVLPLALVLPPALALVMPVAALLPPPPPLS